MPRYMLPVVYLGYVVFLVSHLQSLPSHPALELKSCPVQGESRGVQESPGESSAAIQYLGFTATDAAGHHTNQG